MMIYVVPDLLEEIFLGLPLKSILRFKTMEINPGIEEFRGEAFER